MHSKNDFNIENYIKALSTYIPASSMVKLKKHIKPSLLQNTLNQLFLKTDN